MKVRNQSFVKQVMIRDLGLCRCCGFKASEVHHIVPIIYGGEDSIKNMIALCHTCHLHSPNKKQEFYDYMRNGGARTEILLGKIVNESFRQESLNNNIKSSELISMGRKILLALRECEYKWAMDNYNLRESLEVEDIDFSVELAQNKNNTPKELNTMSNLNT